MTVEALRPFSVREPGSPGTRKGQGTVRSGRPELSAQNSHNNTQRIMHLNGGCFRWWQGDFRSWAGGLTQKRPRRGGSIFRTIKNDRGHCANG